MGVGEFSKITRLLRQDFRKAKTIKHVVYNMFQQNLAFMTVVSIVFVVSFTSAFTFSLKSQADGGARSLTQELSSQGKISGERRQLSKDVSNQEVINALGKLLNKKKSSVERRQLSQILSSKSSN